MPLKTVAQTLGRSFYHVVSSLMTVCVINQLKAVQIHYCERVFLAFRIFRYGGTIFVESTAISDAS